MEILYILLVLLLVTRVCGELAERLGQPALVGELFSGIALGAVVARFTVPILSELTGDPVFRAITDLGVFFLMLYGGIEMHPQQIAKASGASLLVALFGLLLPLLTGFGLGWWFLPVSDYKFAQALFIGTALAITAVPVAIRVLLDLGQLESRAGQIIVSSALFDDVLSLILLAVLTAVAQTGVLPSAEGMLTLAGSILLFFSVTTAIGYFVMPRVGKFIAHFRAGELELSAVLIVAMGFAWLAEALNMHFILGAFMAGLFLGRHAIGRETFREVKKKVSGITNGFLAPIFFASIGLHLDLTALTTIPIFLLLLIAVAFGTKLIGAGLPAYFYGMSRRESLAIGVGMSARGAVELIIADIALQAGLFEHPDPTPPIVARLFSAVVIMAVVTTVSVPIVLRFIFPRPGASDDSNDGGGLSGQSQRGTDT